MANTFTDLFPTLWSAEGFFEMAAESNILSLVDARFLPHAEALRIPRFSYGETSGTHLDSLAVLTASGFIDEVTEESLSVDADEAWGYHFEIKYDEQDRAAADLGAGVAVQRAKALAAFVDRKIVSEMAGALTTITGAIAKGSIVAGVQVLNEGDVPQGDRFMLIGSTAYTAMISDPALTDAWRVNVGPNAPDTNITGIIGMRAGVEIVRVPDSALTGLGDAVACMFHRSAVVAATVTELERRVYDNPRRFATGYTGRLRWGSALVHPEAAVLFELP